MRGITLNSFKVKLALLYISIVILGFASIYVFVPNHYTSNALSSIENNHYNLVNSLKETDDISNFVKSFYDNKLAESSQKIQYYLLFDGYEKLIFSYRFVEAKKLGYLVKENDLITSGDSDVFRIASDRKLESGKYYKIFAGYDVTKLQADVAEMRTYILTIGVIVFIVGLVCFVIIGRILIKPLYSIIRAAIEIAEGDFTIRAEVKSRDEIGILAQVFNDMVEKMFTVNYELEHINKELELRVQDRTKELIYAKEKAEESEKLKSAFLAQMSHEIRTPVNTILNFISLVKEEVQPTADENIMECFEAIGSGSRRLIRTIDSVLNMSQFYAGSFEVEYETLSIINDILSDLYMEFQPLADDKKLMFDLNYHAKSDSIIGDRYTITQLFANLIDNAIKYTSEGSVIVSILPGDEERLLIEIEDTGIGMSEEFQKNLFTPFTQEETGYTRKYEGNGLGLALVKNYVDINYGAILVESKKGEGTVFKLYLNKSAEAKKIESESLVIAEND